MKTEPIYRILASKAQAAANCRESGNNEWAQRHPADIDQIMADTAPSGSGIDSGTQFDHEKSTGEKLVFHTAYHHMNDGGYYDGWTEHTVTVRPSLQFGIDIKISGPNRNDIKDYLGDIFAEWLNSTIGDTVSA